MKNKINNKLYFKDKHVKKRKRKRSGEIQFGQNIELGRLRTTVLGPRTCWQIRGRYIY